ncbi:MAG: NAD(P)/FAD-dependent oxidoreductase [Rhodomicrobium sp.]
MTVYDAAIIGGGPAGTALAMLLSGFGRSVILFEKEKQAHDKVCGEFISHEGAHYLARLGVPVEGFGALPIQRVALIRRGHPLTGQLPFEAWSLSRRVLDEALLQRAAQTGAEVRRGSRVRELFRWGDGWKVEIEGGGAFSAKDAFLATGKHDLKRWKRPPGQQSDLIAFKAYWRLSPRQAESLRGRVELLLFPGGYAGLQPVEGGRANLCLLIRKSMFVRKYGSWDNLLNAMLEACPHLASRLDGAACLSSKPLGISGLPYGHVTRKGGELWRLGDQAAVIPSFSGDGMSIALHSAHLAAAMCLQGKSPDEYQQQLASQVTKQVARATLLSQTLVSKLGQPLAMAATFCSRSTLALCAASTRIRSDALVFGDVSSIV